MPIKSKSEVYEGMPVRIVQVYEDVYGRTGVIDEVNAVGYEGRADVVGVRLTEPDYVNGTGRFQGRHASERPKFQPFSIGLLEIDQEHIDEQRREKEWEDYRDSLPQQGRQYGRRIQLK